MTYSEINTDPDLNDWIAQGIQELEQSLEHHADFDQYLANHKEEPQWTSST